MGRYSTEASSFQPQNNAYSNSGGYNQNQSSQANANINQQIPSNWPAVFPKPVIGIDLNGTIIDDVTLRSPSNVTVLPGVLEAIKQLRLKGHKLMIISDQPEISKNIITSENVDEAFQLLMQRFGAAGILSIDGFLYNTSDFKEDNFAKPNTGMIEKAQTDSGGSINFRQGWYVGDSIEDLKMAHNAKSIPVLIKTGQFEKALEQLERHSNKELKKKTLVFNSLLEFANSLN
jgi:HAD superfamily hydrolase (TIGR01662 family)